MSAGTGILHSEKNDSCGWTTSAPNTRNRCILCRCGWSRTKPGLTPGYQQLEIDAELATGALVTVASGLPRYRDRTAIEINSSHSPCTWPGYPAPTRQSTYPTRPICICLSHAAR